jgi:hypothetical protein
MSEYQYYEFHAIDRSLTEEEQEAVSGLSSRVEPHPWRAVFVYHWSGFPARAEQVLAKYYDAMLYVANWGSRRLMFRFPQSLIDLREVEEYCRPYYVEEYVSLSPVGEHVILNVEFNPEGGADWIDGEGWLDSLIPLREDLLRGDYRLLYMAWLKTLEVEEVLDSVLEPPVPPGLKKLSPALRAFAELFEVDADLIEVAAEHSARREDLAQDDLHRAIAQLPPAERDAFLLRLARGEEHLSVAFRQRLGEFMQRPQVDAGARRTVGQLLAAAEALGARRRRETAAQAEARRIADLQALAGREDQAWQQVESLVEKGTGKSYDEAVQLLRKLRDLAAYQGQPAAFQERMDGISQRYSRRQALVKRLQRAGLPGR